MRYFLDTEFHDDGRTIDLISIGIAAEDGREYYAVSADFDHVRAMAVPWLRDNVLNRIGSESPFRTRTAIANEVCRFMRVRDGRPEIWGYYADYDWVAFCQLFGRMIDLPKGLPKFCMDIKQLCNSIGNPTLPPQSADEHHALVDARWNKAAYEFCVGEGRRRHRSRQNANRLENLIQQANDGDYGIPE